MRISQTVSVHVGGLDFLVTVDHQPDGGRAFVDEHGDFFGGFAGAEIADHQPDLFFSSVVKQRPLPRFLTRSQKVR